jgi:MraZ protein
MSSHSSGPFRGRFEIKLDPKGRIGLPPAFRDIIESARASADLVVTNSRYRNRSCLDVYTAVEWEKLERRIGKLSTLKPEVQAFNRFYLSGGQGVEIDAQNRILVPQSLRRYGMLDQQVVLVGMGSKFEIWSQESWNAIHEQLTESFEETMNAVAALEQALGDEE